MAQLRELSDGFEFVCVNDNDGNEWFTLVSKNNFDAALEALTELGYCLVWRKEPNGPES